MYTGDDFNYPELIRGDEHGHSDALLGIFDAIAPAAAAALARARRRATATRYDAILAPTVPLSRHIFAAPTYHYKTGVVFLAYLNGHQRPLPHGRRAGERRARSRTSPSCSCSPTAARLLRDPELAAARMRARARARGGRAA